VTIQNQLAGDVMRK